jgi:hypothetical protein
MSSITAPNRRSIVVGTAVPKGTGVSVRWRIQRQSATVASMIHVGLPIAAADHGARHTARVSGSGCPPRSLCGALTAVYPSFAAR